MNSVLKPLGVFGGILFVGSQIFAAVPEKYQTILDRNAFGLLPPPPPVVESAPVAPPLDIKLTGFATIAGVRRVYFVIPPKTPQDHYQYISLSEGESESDIEVLSISELDEVVKVRNAGILSTLSLTDNGFQSSKESLAVAQNRASVTKGIVSSAPTNPQMISSPVYNPSASMALASNPAGVLSALSNNRRTSVSNGIHPDVQPLVYNGQSSGVGSMSAVGGITTRASVESAGINNNGGNVQPTIRSAQPTSGSNPGFGGISNSSSPIANYPGELHNATDEELLMHAGDQMYVEARLRELRRQYGHPESNPPPGPQ